MNAKPLRDIIFVSKDEQVKQSASGLFLPGEDKHVTGTALAVGPGKHSDDGSTVIPLSVVVGDKVMFNKNMAIEATVEGVTLYLLREEQLLCIVSS